MLVIRDLVKVYPGPVAALQGIHLEIGGGMFGLLGPNGAGKTTLMRITAGLLEATSGQITLDGHDILNHPDWVWERLGYLPQEFGFFPHLTGEQMLTYLLRLKGIEAPQGLRALCGELLEQVNLSFAARRRVKSYSGGMRQRLGIAQAIAGNPRLIIVDEPTAGLDPEERLRLYRILAELAADRIVLLSTHIVEDVAVLCPRFAIIRRGRLIAESSPSRARAALEGMIFEGESSAADLADLRRRHHVTNAILVEGQHRVRIYDPARRPPSGFSTVAPTLEDAYLVLMQQDGSPGAEVMAPVGGSAPAGDTVGGIARAPLGDKAPADGDERFGGGR